MYTYNFQYYPGLESYYVAIYDPRGNISAQFTMDCKRESTLRKRMDEIMADLNKKEKVAVEA